jgi:uncharacterized protein DUF1496
MPSKTRELGAQNPELKNSPIAWESDEDIETLRGSQPSEPVCFFNDHEYAHGTIVQSGSVRLRCERGVWVPAGPSATSRT